MITSYNSRTNILIWNINRLNNLPAGNCAFSQFKKIINNYNVHVIQMVAFGELISWVYCINTTSVVNILVLIWIIIGRVIIINCLYNSNTNDVILLVISFWLDLVFMHRAIYFVLLCYVLFFCILVFRFYFCALFLECLYAMWFFFV